jgi:hypothetical protein
VELIIDIAHLAMLAPATDAREVLFVRPRRAEILDPARWNGTSER